MPCLSYPSAKELRVEDGSPTIMYIYLASSFVKWVEEKLMPERTIPSIMFYFSSVYKRWRKTTSHAIIEGWTNIILQIVIWVGNLFLIKVLLWSDAHIMISINYFFIQIRTSYLPPIKELRKVHLNIGFQRIRAWISKLLY